MEKNQRGLILYRLCVMRLNALDPEQVASGANMKCPARDTLFFYGMWFHWRSIYNIDHKVVNFMRYAG